MVGTNTGMVSGAEDIAVDIKAGPEDEVEEAVADGPVVAAVKVASAVVTRFVHSNKII
jgi:hypothetical protein